MVCATYGKQQHNSSQKSPASSLREHCFSLHSLVFTSWSSYLSPCLGVLLLPGGGGGRICLALMNPRGLPKTPTLNLLKCIWQALKRLLSLTKMGSIKMSDETKRLLSLPLILVEHQCCVIAVTYSNMKEIISANYPFSYNTGFVDIWGSDRKCRNQVVCWGGKKRTNCTEQTPHLLSAPAGVRHRGNFLLF